MKNIAIAILTIAVIVLSQAVARLDNFRYAYLVGLCSDIRETSDADRVKRYQCLSSAQPRDSQFWSIYYGVTDK